MKEDRTNYQAAAGFIRERCQNGPRIAMVLGTALGGLAQEIEEKKVIPYKDIPGFLVSTAQGHAGELIIGKLRGRDILCMSGRFHYYEGYDFSQLLIPIRVFKLLGVRTLLLTNAAGAVNGDYRPGDAMIIKDHLNLAGASPTRGKNDEEFGPRFFDMSNAYDASLRELAREEGRKASLQVHEGIYAYFPGPQFETPAEIRMSRILGADAVGMSTVPEVIAAVHCGMRVLGISLITNMAAGMTGEALDGSELVKTGELAKAGMQTFIGRILEKM